MSDSIEINRIIWVRIGKAAQRSGVGVRKLRQLIDDRAIRSLQHDDELWIPESTILRLRRDRAATIPNANRKLGAYGRPAESRDGPLSKAKDQQVLPMSSGREGQGWLGQKKRD
ncbi:MAG: hypothetical protein B7Y45_11485 [Sphingomonas sp. 28-66-16]|nr:MAG: hypothetical protein B7Y45_11485 [Sphingomonas sp. 28-66-16]